MNNSQYIDSNFPVELGQNPNPTHSYYDYYNSYIDPNWTQVNYDNAPVHNSYNGQGNSVSDYSAYQVQHAISQPVTVNPPVGQTSSVLNIKGKTKIWNIPISVIDSNKEVQCFPSINLAAKFLGRTSSSLYTYYLDKDKVINFEDKLYKIKKGDLRNKDLSSEEFKIKFRGKPISLIHSPNKVVFFPQLKLAADFLNTSSSNIIKWYLDKDKTFNFEDKLYKVKKGDLRNKDFSTENFKRGKSKKNG